MIDIDEARRVALEEDGPRSVLRLLQVPVRDIELLKYWHEHQAEVLDELAALRSAHETDAVEVACWRSVKTMLREIGAPDEYPPGGCVRWIQDQIVALRAAKEDQSVDGGFDLNDLPDLDLTGDSDSVDFVRRSRDAKETP